MSFLSIVTKFSMKFKIIFNFIPTAIKHILKIGTLGRTCICGESLLRGYISGVSRR